MDENSTSASIEKRKPSTEKGLSRMRPRKSTIEFLQQFARCYQVLPALPAAVNVVIPN